MPKLSEKLTDKVMRKLPAPEKGNQLWYDPELRGFAGRVTYKAARAFVLVYHFHGEERRDTIGGWPVWTASAARDVAKSWKRDADLGIDPRGKDASDDPKAATFKARAEQYLVDPRKKRQKTALRPATKREYKRALLTYAKPLHAKPFDALRRLDVANLLETVKGERGAASAMRTRAAIGRLYSWGIARGYVEYNPVTGTEGWETPKRERELSDDELRALWQATTEPTDYHRIVRVIIWTGARPSEVAGMAWSELENGAWTFTAERAKNGRPLALPLPHQARAELDEVKRRKGRDQLFGFGPNGFRGWSKAKRELDALVARNNAEQRLGRKLADGEEPLEGDAITAWQLRDLRRSVETRLASVGVPQEHINRILNHAQAPITVTYNRYEYLEEKRAALQRWADELDRIVCPPSVDSNVVRLTGRR
jgi:integrase